MDEIKQFNPNDIMQGVKDRIKATFVDMIPDEQWESMIKKECDDFLNGRPNNSWGSNNGRYFPEFKKIVENELQEECKRRMKEYLSSKDFETTWVAYGEPVCCKAVEKIIIENSGSMLINMFGGIFSSMLDSFKHNLMNPR